MRLNREERDYYVLDITTAPALSGTWQAAFVADPTPDDWFDGTQTDDGWAWLVAGPDFSAPDVDMNPDDTVAVIPRTLRPLVRLKDDPVLDVKVAPAIRLE